MGVIANVSAAIYLYAGCGKGAADFSAIKVFECNRETGEIRSIQEINGPQSTTYFQLLPDGKSLYAPAENVGIGDAGDAWMVRFPVEENGRLGALEALAKLPCEAPCHVALSPDAKTIAFASYLSGTIGVMPACKDGKVVFRRLPDIGVGSNRKRQTKAYAEQFHPSAVHSTWSVHRSIRSAVLPGRRENRLCRSWMRQDSFFQDCRIGADSGNDDKGRSWRRASSCSLVERRKVSFCAQRTL